MTDGGIWQPRDLPVLPPLSSAGPGPEPAVDPDGPGEDSEARNEPVGEAEASDDSAVAFAPEPPSAAAPGGPDAASPDAALAYAPVLPSAAAAGAADVEVSAPERSEVTSVEFTPDLLEADLLAVDVALSRLDAGEYGRCQVCDLTLDDAVMAADPTVAVCPAHVGLRPALAS